MSDEPGVRFGLATAAEVVALLVTGFGVLTFDDADLARLAAFVSGTMLLTWLVLRAEVPGGTAD